MEDFEKEIDAMVKKGEMYAEAQKRLDTFLLLNAAEMASVLPKQLKEKREKYIKEHDEIDPIWQLLLEQIRAVEEMEIQPTLILVFSAAILFDCTVDELLGI